MYWVNKINGNYDFDRMKMSIVVRKDLAMGKGKIAAQVAHAAVDCAMRKSGKVDQWVSEGQKKVVVWAKDENELISLVTKAKSMGVRVCEIRDAGRTQLDPDTLTCAAFGPDEEEIIDKITGGLKLL